MNKKKLIYEKPAVNIICFAAQDIITTSTGFPGNDDPLSSFGGFNGNDDSFSGGGFSGNDDSFD